MSDRSTNIELNVHAKAQANACPSGIEFHFATPPEHMFLDLGELERMMVAAKEHCAPWWVEHMRLLFTTKHGDPH